MYHLFVLRIFHKCNMYQTISITIELDTILTNGSWLSYLGSHQHQPADASLFHTVYSCHVHCNLNIQAWLHRRLKAIQTNDLMCEIHAKITCLNNNCMLQSTVLSKYPRRLSERREQAIFDRMEQAILYYASCGYIMLQTFNVSIHWHQIRNK